MGASGALFGGGADGAAGAATGGSGILDMFKNASQGSVGGLFGILQHLFGNNKEPYTEGFNATKPYFENAKAGQNPFVKQGQEAGGNYNNWLGKMSNPQDFINNTMNNYQESPWAKYLQNASNRAGTNAASAEGTIGSTPFAQQQQQNAASISSGDMQNWLKNVLGVNTEYGGGLQNQVGQGQHASDILSQLFSNQGNLAGGAEYGKTAYNNQNDQALWANIAKMFGG